MSTNAFSAAYSTAFDTDAATTGGCTWPVSYLSCADCPPLSELSGDEQALVEQMATDYLWRWTGRKFGLCPVSVRPCKDDCTEGASTFYGSGPYTDAGPMAGGWRPVIIDGLWFNVGCGRCGDKCSCSYTPSITLPGPVDSITRVLIDGQPLDPTAYRVDNHRYLVRTDGDDWPACQDMSRPTTLSPTPAEAISGPNSIVVPPSPENTFEVSYLKGTPVPAGGQTAAGVLACEFAKALCRDSTCALPQRLQSITRQGVSVAVLDSFDDIDTGHTGIWLIDSWVASVTKPAVRSRVYSPDVPRERNRRTTWSAT